MNVTRPTPCVGQGLSAPEDHALRDPWRRALPVMGGVPRSY